MTTRTSVSTALGIGYMSVAMRSLTTLSRVDYADSFTAPKRPSSPERTPEAWARAILEDTPLGRRARRLWRILGLRMGPRRSEEHVQGWGIDASGDDWIRLETSSWYATAQAVCRVDDEVSIALFFRYDRPIARLIWAAVAPMHRRAVPVLLHQALEQPGG